MLDLRAAPVAPGARDVLAHDALGPVAVARLDRGEKLRVLGDVGVLPVGLRAPPREEAPADVGDPERVDEPEERVVPRRLRDREMERATGVVCDRGRAGRPLVVDRRRSAARSLSVRRSAARRARTGSRCRRTSRRSRTRPRPRSATKKPRFTSNSTSPSPTSRRSASRTEPREMPSASASSACPTRAPGARRPSTIIARSSSYASPTTERTRSGPGLASAHRVSQKG